MDTIKHSRKVGVEQSNEIGDQSVESKEVAADENKRTTYGKLFQTAWRPIEEYCSNSNLHGVRYFVEEKRHCVERFWWIFGFVVSICCCGALIHKVYMNWDQKSVIITIADEEMPVWDIPFPAVTICPSNKVDDERFNNTDLYEHAENQKEIVSKVTKEEAEIENAVSYLCDYDGSSNDNFTDPSFIEILRKAIPHLNTAINDCLFDNDYTDCDFEEIITDHGVCLTFNMLNSKETYYDDSIYSHLRHNKMSHWSLDYGYDLKNITQIYPYRLFGSGADGQKLDFALSASKHRQNCFVPGFYIVLHTPGEIPQVSKYSFHVTPTSSTFVALKPNIIATSEELKSYHPDRRKCYFNSERKLSFLRIYTQRNCELECLANVTLSLCGCVAFYMPRDAATPICGLGKTKCYIWARDNLMKVRIWNAYNATEEQYLSLKLMVKNCNCLPACNAITYETDILTNELSEASYVNLSIFFKERKFITMARSELYGPIDFIANCGGLLGLFIGASFLSIVEILYYFSLRLCCKSQANANTKSKILISKKRTTLKSKNPIKILRAPKIVIVRAARDRKRIANLSS